MMKANSKGSRAGSLVHLDAGSTNCVAQENPQVPEDANDWTFPRWLFDARLCRSLTRFSNFFTFFHSTPQKSGKNRGHTRKIF